MASSIAHYPRGKYSFKQASLVAGKGAAGLFPFCVRAKSLMGCAKGWLTTQNGTEALAKKKGPQHFAGVLFVETVLRPR
jgi:hypothetical protein